MDSTSDCECITFTDGVALRWLHTKDRVLPSQPVRVYVPPNRDLSFPLYLKGEAFVEIHSLDSVQMITQPEEMVVHFTRWVSAKSPEELKNQLRKQNYESQKLIAVTVRGVWFRDRMNVPGPHEYDITHIEMPHGSPWWANRKTWLSPTTEITYNLYGNLYKGRNDMLVEGVYPTVMSWPKAHFFNEQVMNTDVEHLMISGSVFSSGWVTSSQLRYLYLSNLDIPVSISPDWKLEHLSIHNTPRAKLNSGTYSYTITFDEWRVFGAGGKIVVEKGVSLVRNRFSRLLNANVHFRQLHVVFGWQSQPTNLPTIDCLILGSVNHPVYLSEELVRAKLQALFLFRSPWLKKRTTMKVDWSSIPHVYLPEHLEITLYEQQWLENRCVHYVKYD